MDIERPVDNGKKWRKLGRYGVVGSALIAVLMYSWSRSAALPTVDRETVVIGVAEHGDMVRRVSGTGEFVPVYNRLIPSVTAGTVEEVHVLPGAPVQTDTVLLTLSNSEVLKAYREAKLRLNLAQAEYDALLETQEDEALQQEEALLVTKADRDAMALQLASEKDLLKEHLVSRLDYQRTELQSKQLAEQVTLQERRLNGLPKKHKAERFAKQAELDLLVSQLELEQEQVDGLQVRAELGGVVQEINVEVGQSVVDGEILARVAGAEQLKAELRVAETQARDVAIGQLVELGYGTARTTGTVSRIDPSVRNGTVTIEVALDDAQPNGARPNLRISGTVEVERLSEVLYVGRPSTSNLKSNTQLYVLGDDGGARLTNVVLGKQSLSNVAVESGLKVGQRVILSDLSALNGAPEIVLQ